MEPDLKDDEVFDFKGDSFKVPIELAENGQSTKALLFGVIVHLSGEDGYCWVTNRYLAGSIGKKSVTQIKTYLKELAKEGWVKVVFNDEFGRRIYPILIRR